MRAESITFLKNIVNAPSPSGFETPAAKAYRDYTEPWADQVTTDNHGNVVAVLNPEASAKVMLAGHMDEIGLLVHYVSDDGFLSFSPIGGHDTTVPIGQRVWVHAKGGRVPGVIGRKPIHLIESSDRDKKPELYDMWIDIGVSSKEEALKHIELGDPVTYQVEFMELAGGRACARGFDNKVGAFCVAEALRLLHDEGGLDPNVGVYAVGTVQEEIGLRGARTSAFSVDAQSGLAVDVDFAIDHPGLNKARYGDVALGKGPSVCRGANINPIVYRMVQEGAAKEGVSLQVAPEPGGTGTDANAMQITRGGMATGLVGVPLRYMHTPVETLQLSDVEECARVMAAYCRLVKPDTDFRPGLG